jgi:hypothetical protein
MGISILDYNNYEPNEEDIKEAADQPGTKLMEKWINGNTNFWNSFDEDYCDDDELWELIISQLTLRYENITIQQLYYIIVETLGQTNEWYGSYAIAMKTMQKEFPKWSSEDLHLLVRKEFPDHVTAADETSHVNRDGILGPDDNNNNNNVNDNNDDFMKEAGKFPPTEVSSPVNMHNNNPFSASVIRKDEINVALLDVSSNLNSIYGNNSNGNNNNNNNNDNNSNNNNDNNNCKEVDENHNKKNNIEVCDLNGANVSSKDSKISIIGNTYEDNNNNIDNNDDKNNVRTEEVMVPPVEVSSPVNMHNNNPFSASVIRKDEIDVATLDVSSNLDSKYGNNSNGNNINNNNNNTNNNIDNNNNNNDNNNCKEVDENHNKKNNIEDYDLNGANISSKDSKINNNGISYEDNYNNNDNNDDKNNVRTEEVIVPPIEVSSPVNMHNNNPFSASVIRKDEVVVGGAFAPYFLDPILHFLSSLLLPPSAPPFSLAPFPSTSMAFYLSPCLPPPLLYPIALLYYFNMSSVYRTNFPGQFLLKSRVRLALPQNGAA